MFLNGGEARLGKVFDDAGLAIDFRALFEASPTPFLVVSPADFAIVAVNNAYLRATMARREEIVGRRLFEVFPGNPDDPGADGVGNLRASLERVLINRRADAMAVQKFYIRRTSFGGSAFEERYWSPINIPVPGPNGGVACILHRVEAMAEIVRLRSEAAAHDQLACDQQQVVIDRLRAANHEAARIEAELRESRAEIECRAHVYDTALSSISDFAYIFDREGRFVYVNKPLLDLWGLTLEDAVGKNFFELQYPNHLVERLQRQIQQAFETRQGLTDETPYTSPADEGGYYEYIFRPVFGADGSVEVVVGSTRDITERKRLAAILHDGLQQLLVAAKMRLGQARSQIRDPAVISTIENVTDLLCQAVDSSRNLTLQLRPPYMKAG